MSPKLKLQLTSASRTADWPGQGDLVKAKHNAKKGWGFALFFIGREKKHAVELPFLTYSCISAFSILLCATLFGSTSTVTWYLLPRLQGAEEIILFFIRFETIASSVPDTKTGSNMSKGNKTPLLSKDSKSLTTFLIHEDINVLALNANKFILILSGHFHYCDNKSDATKVPLFQGIQGSPFCFDCFKLRVGVCNGWQYCWAIELACLKGFRQVWEIPRLGCKQFLGTRFLWSSGEIQRLLEQDFSVFLNILKSFTAKPHLLKLSKRKRHAFFYGCY